MSTEILINVTPHETRVAVVENGALQDIIIERMRKRGLVGNIYKGKVARVLPGMQAAFVEIGLARSGFLHASDVLSARMVDRDSVDSHINTPTLTGSPFVEIRQGVPAGQADAYFEERLEPVLAEGDVAIPDYKPRDTFYTDGNGMVNEAAGALSEIQASHAGHDGNGGAANRPRREHPQALETISSLLHEGQEVLVQVVKDPLGSKGARLTMHISIPSRYLVFMAGTAHLGVSQKIESPEERQRLREIVSQCTAEQGNGYILRTAAEGVSEEELRADVQFLQKLWSSIEERARLETAATIIHEDLPLVMRTLRDLARAEVEKLRIDSRETYQRLVQFAGNFMAPIASRIEHYPGERPIFDLYGVEDEIQKALERKVPLKSGGYLIIDQTEAMATIDVNTGAFVGHRNLEDTIFTTNLEAAQTIARQLRLRNLGGIIIIDFIDMQDPLHRRQVLRALEKSLERDHAKTHISGVSALGLVEMTRKRTRDSLERLLCEPCPTCKGRASLKTAETVCYEIFREILRTARQFDARRILVLAAQEVIDVLLDEESTSLADLEEFIGRPIKLQVESLYTQEQYDVVLA